MESNITITSNIYPIKSRYLNEDKKYLNKVEGYEALSLLKQKTRYELNSEQEIQYSNGQQCTYNLDGEFAWGLVKTADGDFKEKCRCRNEKCRLFSKCRKDYKTEEQNIFKEGNSSKQERNNYTLIDIIPKKLNKDNKGNKENNLLPKGIVDSSESIFETKQIQVEKHKEVVEDKKYEFTTQKDIIEASANLQLLVNAAPGTGKTYTLIEKIKYLYQVEGLEPTSELLVLCFSRAAVGEIRKRINNAISEGMISDELRFLDIRTFDSFATYLIKELVEDIDLTNVSYDERIEMANKVLNENPDCLEDLRHFIVDEVQDLVGVRARFVQSIISNLTGGITLLGDACQSIYDYQVNDNDDVTSEEFLLWVKNKFKNNLKEAELLENHRMNSQILKLSTEVRNVIKSNSNLNVNKNTIINVLDSIINNNKILEIDIDSIQKHKKTCILCRTNGEALKLSNLLRNNSVESSIVKSAECKNISAWVAQILSNVEYNTFDYDTFEKIAKSFNINEIELKWKLLSDLQRKNSSKIDISAIQDSLINDHSSLTNLYSMNDSNLEISTIHRSKGKEYDEIILFDDSFRIKLENIDDNEAIKQELKTFYVAITRAKDKLNRVHFGRKAYLKKLKGVNERWVTLGTNKKRNPYISFLEIGKPHDVDNMSFINSSILDKSVAENQIYINREIKVGDEITLMRVDDINGFKKVRYNIVHNNIVIGSMSDNFTKAIYYSIKEVSGYFSEFPVVLTQIYVDDIVTYFDKKVDVKTDECFRKNKLWNGITINTFGKLSWKVGDV